mmetsp:Transcript_1789/g.6905  ORF Transcript_1789/g.6905 Transcript_1789/m.6905 type:complete len:218 (+) Transcript_1789:1284-1937(+)
MRSRALASTRDSVRRSPKGATTIETTTATTMALAVASGISPRARSTMTKATSPKQPHEKPSVQKSSQENTGDAKKPAASLPSGHAAMPPTTAARAKDVAFKSWPMGTREKPTVAAKKMRSSQRMMRFTCVSHTVWTARSEQKQSPARKAPRRADDPEYAQAGISASAVAKTAASTASARRLRGILGKRTWSKTRGTTRTAKKPTKATRATNNMSGTT